VSKPRILVVDDEPDILELVSFNLSKHGYEVQCVTSGEAALEAVRTDPPDAMVLDLMLPGVDGLDVCRQIKSDAVTRSIPILMLTAKGEEREMVAGLEQGADDYVAKPFSPRVLVARVKAILRRKPAEPADATAVLKVGSLSIHPGRREVSVDGEPVQLTFTEFGILHFLARRPGWVFTRTQIVDGVQGQDVAVTDRSVDVHIVALRRKLGPVGELVETVRGVGYRFKDQ
jgi:DNA-binding response OmpR family regulator